MKNLYFTLILLLSVVSYGDDYQKICKLVSSNDTTNLTLLLEDKKNVQLIDKINRTLLFCAADTGAYKSAKLLLDKGIDPNIKDKSNRTPLEELFISEHLSHIPEGYGGPRKKSHDFIKTAMVFLQFGANVNTIGTDDIPIWWEVRLSLLLKMSLVYGADVNFRDKNGRNALMYFAQKALTSGASKRMDMLQILLSHGADIQNKDNEGKDILKYFNYKFGKYTFFKNTHYPQKLENKTLKYFLRKAIQEHDYETIELLLKIGDFDNKEVSSFEYKIIFYAMEDSKILNLFSSYGLDIRYAKSYHGSFLLGKALREGNMDGVKFVLEHSEKDLNNFNVIKNIMDRPDDNISIQIADFLFSKGLKASIIDKDGRTLLHLAAKKHRNRLCQYFLDKGITADVRDNNKITPIFYDLHSRENSSCAKILFMSGADIHQKMPTNITLLHAAAKGNHIDVIKYLLDQGLDPNETDENGHSTLYHAIENENTNFNILKLLLEHGEDIKAVDKEGNSLLHYASTKYKPMDVVKFLLDKGLDVDIRNNKGQTALLNALKNNNLHIASYLINNKADINIQDNEGDSLLHYAVKKNMKTMAIFLLLNGASKSLKDKNGLTVLDLVNKMPESDRRKYLGFLEGNYLFYIFKKSQMSGFRELNDLILYEANGGKLDVKVHNDQTLLHAITANKNFGSEDEINYLLVSGLNVNAKDSEGKTALYLTTLNSRYEMAKVLLNNGANVNLQTENGDTPLINAVRENDHKMVSLLLDYNSNPNIVNEQKDTALHMAVVNVNAPIVKTLLDKKADPDQVDDMGLSPLDYARKFKLTEIITMLEALTQVTKNSKPQNLVPEEAVQLPENNITIHDSTPIDNKYMQTKLHQAVASGNLDEVKELLKNPINVNTVDKLGRTPLHYAAFRGYVEIANLLLVKGADINAVDSSKQWTPLFFAVYMHQKVMIEFLIEKGADQTVKDTLNKTADDYRKDK